jgi:hypothetical protein
MNKLATIKMIQQMITKRSTLPGAIIPLGISRIAVLGLRASKCLSRYRLNAIAALRAVTMQTSTRKKRVSRTELSGMPPSWINGAPNMPRKNPIMANGNANKVWENLTRLR